MKKFLLILFVFSLTGVITYRQFILEKQIANTASPSLETHNKQFSPIGENLEVENVPEDYGVKKHIVFLQGRINQNNEVKTLSAVYLPSGVISQRVKGSDYQIEFLDIHKKIIYARDLAASNQLAVDTKDGGFTDYLEDATYSQTFEYPLNAVYQRITFKGKDIYSDNLVKQILQDFIDHAYDKQEKYFLAQDSDISTLLQQLEEKYSAKDIPAIREQLHKIQNTIFTKYAQERNIVEGTDEAGTHTNRENIKIYITDIEEKL